MDRRLVISVVEVVEGGARTVEAPETPGRIARGIDTSVIPASPTLSHSTPLLLSPILFLYLPFSPHTFSILMRIHSAFHILHSCAFVLCIQIFPYSGIVFASLFSFKLLNTYLYMIFHLLTIILFHKLFILYYLLLFILYIVIKIILIYNNALSYMCVCVSWCIICSAFFVIYIFISYYFLFFSPYMLSNIVLISALLYNVINILLIHSSCFLDPIFHYIFCLYISL